MANREVSEKGQVCDRPDRPDRPDKSCRALTRMTAASPYIQTKTLGPVAAVKLVIRGTSRGPGIPLSRFLLRGSEVKPLVEP